MAQQRDHEKLVRDFMTAYDARDADAVAECLAPEASMRVPGGHQLAGTFDGRDAVLDHLRRLWRQPDSVWRFAAVEDWLVSDQRVLLIAGMHAQLPGRRHDWRRYMLVNVPETGVRPPDELRIAELHVFEADDQRLVDEFVDREYVP